MRGRLQVQLVDRYVLVAGELTRGRTLTNDAEGVIAYLRETGALYMAHDTTQHRRVLYADSEGTWDELQHDGRRFTGFRSVGGCDAGDALVRAGAQR